MQISVLSCIFNGFRASLVFWFFGLIRRRGRGICQRQRGPGYLRNTRHMGKEPFSKISQK